MQLIRELWQTVRQALCRWFGCRPDPVTYLEARIAMITAKLTWTDPESAFDGVEIAMRVEGAPDFTPITLVEPGVEEATIPDLVDGKYDFQATVVNGSKRSAARGVSVTVESTPDPVEELEVSLSEG